MQNSEYKSRGQADGSESLSSTSTSSDRWTRMRAAVQESGPQACRTTLVFLLSLLLVLPMLIAQTLLKNWAAAHERDPPPELDPLDRPLPDILLNSWEERSVSAYWLRDPVNQHKCQLKSQICLKFKGLKGILRGSTSKGLRGRSPQLQFWKKHIRILGFWRVFVEFSGGINLCE